jgi:ABC-type nitrate/sulfonate/bicarbonate transport system permease component
LDRGRKALFFAIDLGIILLVWMLISNSSEIASQYVLPPPNVVFGIAVESLRDGSLLGHIGASMKRTGMGFSFAIFTALPLGLVLGWSDRLYAIADPVIEILRPISPIAWIPLAILWFGIGEMSKVFIIWLLVFFFIFLNTVNGVKGVNPKLIDAARTLGASTFFLFFKVVIPAALPDILTGLRLGLGVSIGAVLIAEMVAATSGIGYMMERARVIIDPSTVIMGLVVIGLLGYIINLVFVKIEGRLKKHQIAPKV